MSAVAVEARERRSGRYVDLISRAEDFARRLRGRGMGDEATTMSVLCDIIIRQEIELRQAIADKCARPVVERR